MGVQQHLTYKRPPVGSCGQQTSRATQPRLQPGSDRPHAEPTGAQGSRGSYFPSVQPHPRPPRGLQLVPLWHGRFPVGSRSVPRQPTGRGGTGAERCRPPCALPPWDAARALGCGGDAGRVPVRTPGWARAGALRRGGCAGARSGERAAGRAAAARNGRRWKRVRAPPPAAAGAGRGGGGAGRPGEPRRCSVSPCRCGRAERSRAEPSGAEPSAAARRECAMGSGAASRPRRTVPPGDARGPLPATIYAPLEVMLGVLQR